MTDHAYYVERGQGKPHLPVSSTVGKLMVAKKAAYHLHSEAGVIVLRLTKDFLRKLSAN